MDSNTKKELEDLTGRLEGIQLKIEGLMFEAFNQQDKQLKEIKEGMNLLTEVLSHMDAVGFEMEEVALQTKQLAEELHDQRISEKVSGMGDLAEGGLSLLEELAKVFQRLKLGQENSLSCVHEIEEEIANQRSYIEGISDAFLNENER